MKRKRMIKLLMSVGFDRNNAAKAANFCDGSTSRDELYHELCVRIARTLQEYCGVDILHGDMTGAVAGMIGGVDAAGSAYGRL